MSYAHPQVHSLCGCTGRNKMNDLAKVFSPAKFECAKKSPARQLHRTLHTSKKTFKKYVYCLLVPTDAMYQSRWWIVEVLRNGDRSAICLHFRVNNSIANDDTVHRSELPKIIDDGTNNNYGEWETKSYHKLRDWDLLKYTVRLEVGEFYPL